MPRQKARTSMASSIAMKFVVVEREVLWLCDKGRKVEGLKVCWNGNGFHVSIIFWAEEVEWLVNSLILGIRKRFLGRSMLGSKHSLWVARGETRSGKFLVLTEKRDDRRRIIIPDSPQVQGCCIEKPHFFSLVIFFLFFNWKNKGKRETIQIRFSNPNLIFDFITCLL